jgi:hypothetical protein
VNARRGVVHTPIVADDQINDDSVAAGRQAFELLWPVVGNSLPQRVNAALLVELRRLGEPQSWSSATKLRSERLMLSHAGLLAAYYHRDRIEEIEREVVRRIRSAWPRGRPPGTSMSLAMPVLGHEFVAYLLAARRTLDYLARGVATCFNRPSVYRISKLSSGLADAKPADLAVAVGQVCADIAVRFPHLLSREGDRSDRDTAAHYWPIEPAHLLIIEFPNGRVGIELRDAGQGYLQTPNDIDSSRMSRDEPALAAVIDDQLSDMSDFIVRLTSIAVDAALRLRDESQVG